MDNHTINLICDRLARIEKQNDDQLALLHKHLDDAAKTKTVLARHSVYFQLLGVGVPAGIAYVFQKLGLK